MRAKPLAEEWTMIPIHALLEPPRGIGLKEDSVDEGAGNVPGLMQVVEREQRPVGYPVVLSKVAPHARQQ